MQVTQKYVSHEDTVADFQSTETLRCFTRYLKSAYT